MKDSNERGGQPSGQRIGSSLEVPFRLLAAAAILGAVSASSESGAQSRDERPPDALDCPPVQCGTRETWRPRLCRCVVTARRSRSGEPPVAVSSGGDVVSCDASHAIAFELTDAWRRGPTHRSAERRWSTYLLFRILPLETSARASVAFSWATDAQPYRTGGDEMIQYDTDPGRDPTRAVLQVRRRLAVLLEARQSVWERSLPPERVTLSNPRRNGPLWEIDIAVREYTIGRIRISPLATR